ncbi:XRE family transcriptional regulator [Lactobacillus apis]|uniref:XRE family transcriptional regulator n=1 Tax=Lactobacillus apis TaxID=303541 RepID=UPI00242E63C7|nr:XRE family transcriptional regulator [Lactobacillus apis]MCT6890565.1 XRE family transcriptional regulator [Lactobacillus sp.]
MPTTMPGRKLVRDYLTDNGIMITNLAKMYGMKKQDANDYISGKKTTPASNKFILKVIRDFKID